VQGTFSFVAGQVAKTGDMRVETPVATMGIRGTAVLVEISANDGQTKFSVMVEPDGTTGAFNLYSKTTGALIGTVNNSSVGWVVSPAGPLQVVAQQVQKTPAELQQELGIVQQIFTIFNNNQQNPFVPQDSPERRGDNPNDTNPQTAGSSGSGGALTRRSNVGWPHETWPGCGFFFWTLRTLRSCSVLAAAFWAALWFSMTWSGASAMTVPIVSKPARPARPPIWWNSRAVSSRVLVPSYLASAVKTTVRIGTLMPAPRVSVPQMTLSRPS